MLARLLAHLRDQWMGAIALLLVLTGGTAYALDGSNTVFSDDIVNGEVKNDDLAPNSVGSAKIADRQVKNADLSLGASSSNTIADGGIEGIDVKGDTLTGTKIDESTLFNDNSLTGTDVDESSLAGVNADALDGADSSAFLRGSGRVIGTDRTIQAGDEETLLLADPLDVPFNLRYDCPNSPPTQNGAWQFDNEEPDPITLFIDNGSSSPSFAGELPGNGTFHREPTFFGSEYETFSALYPDGRIATTSAFSLHRATDCRVHLQVLLTEP